MALEVFAPFMVAVIAIIGLLVISYYPRQELRYEILDAYPSPDNTMSATISVFNTGKKRISDVHLCVITKGDILDVNHNRLYEIDMGMEKDKADIDLPNLFFDDKISLHFVIDTEAASPISKVDLRSSKVKGEVATAERSSWASVRDILLGVLSAIMALYGMSILFP